MRNGGLFDKARARHIITESPSKQDKGRACLSLRKVGLGPNAMATPHFAGLCPQRLSLSVCQRAYAPAQCLAHGPVLPGLVVGFGWQRMHERPRASQRVQTPVSRAQ
jgi:hypothetical protein